MNRLKYFWIIGCFIFFGCDDFLNVKPDGEIVNDELLKDAEGFEDAIYGVYSTLSSSDFYGKQLSYYLYDILGQYYFFSAMSDVSREINTFKYTNENVRSILDRVWTGMYKNIGYVNNILMNLEKFSPSDMSLYPVYKAECLALRGFLHFEILRGYTENLVTNPNASGIPYSETYSYVVSPFLTASRNYEQIIRDLKDAEKLMEANGEYFDIPVTVDFLKDRVIHFNLYAIQAMLARVYWTKGDMKEAADYALKVIGTEQFELAEKTEIANLLSASLSPKETIWGLYNYDFYSFVYKGLIINTSLTLKDETREIYLIDNEEGGQDYRLEGWFYNYSQTGITGWRIVKLGNGNSPSDRIQGINMIRLPELYYIVAEYYLSIYDQEKAIKYVDEVRMSRGLKAFAEQEGFTLTLDHLIHERQKELILEGQFFHTLKRYNQDIVESYTGQIFKASKDIYVFPIPDTEIDYRDTNE